MKAKKPKKFSRVHFSSKAQDWGTPTLEFARWHKAFRFTRDVAAEKANAKLPRYWSKTDDAFSHHWGPGERNFLNPEYKHAAEWTRKARHEALHYDAFTFGLVPARTSEGWWVDRVAAGEGAFKGVDFCPVTGFTTYRWALLTISVSFVPYRLTFEKPGVTWQAPFPSALVIWEPAGSREGSAGIRRLAMLERSTLRRDGPPGRAAGLPSPAA